MRIWEPQTDYRAKATASVALTALGLLLPFVIVSLLQRSYLMAAGTAGIVAMLAANVRLVGQGRDHEKLTLYALVPAGMLFMIHVFRVDGIIGGVWCYPAILGCYCMLGWRRALIGNAMVLAVALPMVAATLDPALAARFGATLVAVSLFASILVREIDAQQRRLRFQIEHDPMTGLLNRTSLKARLQRAIDRRASRGTPAALLSIDLDHFKRINDSFGHETGDLVLCECARLLRSHVRADDFVFRIGGEEFLVILDDIRPGQARAKAEELRAAIESANILQQRVVTASVGVASLLDGDARAEWTRRSDDRLYAAKRTGRNRVVASDETPSEAREAREAREPIALAGGGGF